MTALGDVPNVAARLASQAKAGEIVVSETLGSAAGLDLETLKRRQLRLKGRKAAVDVRILRLKDRKPRAV
jgi:class 3 adenylate cyclase